MAAYGESNGAETSGVNSQLQDANKFSISSKSSSRTWSNQRSSALSNPSNNTWSNQSCSTLSNPRHFVKSKGSTLLSKQYFAFISVNQVKDVGVADTNQLKSSSKGCWSLSYKPTQVLVTSSQLALNSCLSKLTFVFQTQCQLAGGILETHPSC